MQVYNYNQEDAKVLSTLFCGMEGEKTNLKIITKDSSFTYGKSDETIVCDFTNGDQDSTGQSQRFDYILNPDGTIRWLYPASSKSPLFLQFYYAANLKAKLFIWVVKIAFILGLKNLIKSGSFTCHSASNRRLDKIINNAEDYAVFTGTVGSSRKAVIVIQKEKKVARFIKVPIEKDAFDLVKREFRNLGDLRSRSYKHIITPHFEMVEGCLSQENVRPEKEVKLKQFNKTLANALYELYNGSHHTEDVKTSSFYKVIKQRVEAIEKLSIINNGVDQNAINGLMKFWKGYLENTKSDDVISLGFGHGDMTPWNVFYSSNKLHLFDLEMGSKDYPLLFDFFHYIIQPSILVDRIETNQIGQVINRALGHPTMKAMIAEFGIEPSRYLQHYLIYISTYYAERYIQQPSLHIQANWLLSTWASLSQNENIVSI